MTLRNIGEKSLNILKSVGVHSLADLQLRGWEKVLIDLRAQGHKPTKNMEYALKGALWDMDWRDVAAFELAQQHSDT